MKFRSGLLAASLLASTSVHAQGADEAAGNTDAQEIIVFAPILEAQERALEEQRSALNRVDILSSDTVGRFADQTVAGALARLPAVAVQRDQGQERYIQVRGAPNRWTSVKFDGVPVIGVDEGGSTRAFRFDAIPAVLLSTIALNKSLMAEMPAEAVVGQIDLRSWSPFEKEGFGLSGDVGAGVMGLGMGLQRQANLRASWSNDRFGIVIGGSNYRRRQTTDNREAAYDADGAPTILDFRSYILERENLGAFARAEWKPSEDHKLFIGTTYTEFNDDEQRNQYVMQLTTAVPGGVRGVDQGSLVSVQNRGTLSDGDYRNNNWITTAGGDHGFGDAWKLSWRVNYTETESTTYLPILLQQANNRLLRPSIDYDLTGNRNLPTVQVYQTVPGPTAGTFARGPARSFIDQAAYDFQIFLPIVQDTRSNSWTGLFDVSREFERVTLKAGMQIDDRAIDGNTLASSNTLLLTPNLPLVGERLNPGDYLTQTRWSTRFPSGFSTPLVVDNPRLFKDVDRILGKLEAIGRYNPALSVPAANLYTIDEQLYAGYVQGTFEFDKTTIVAGVRYEKLNQVIEGFLQAAGRPPVATTIDKSFGDWFPSVNLRHDLTDRAVLRGSVQRSTARPSFGEVRVGASISDISNPGTITGGNPLLLPEYTWGIDGALEYYIPGGGLASVSAFSRFVSNVLYTGRSINDSDIYDEPGVDRTGYIISSTFNGDKGKLYGVEFSYQQQWAFLPAPWDGLGFQGNVALLGGSFDAPGRSGAPFPGTSDVVVNASIFYEKNGISARLAYQWRSDWPDTLGGFGVQGELGDEFRKAYGNLDLTLRYAVSKNFILYADLANLTNATYVVFEDEPFFPVEVEQIGRRYMMGVRFDF